MEIALIVIVTILALVVGLFVYYGGLIKVTCRIENQGGEKIVYKKMVGDYAKSAKLMNEIYYSLLNDHGIETFKGFGIYYDNPKEVEKSKLRSEIGCIIDDKDSPKLAKITEGLNIKTLPERSYLVAEFPSKGKLSILCGILKVYPAIEKFVEEKHYKKEGAIMEIYDVPNNKIIYRKEIVE